MNVHSIVQMNVHAIVQMNVHAIVQMNVYTDRSNERKQRSLLRTLNLVMAAHGLSQKDLEKAQQAIDTLSSIVSDRPGPSRLSSDHGTGRSAAPESSE